MRAEGGEDARQKRLAELNKLKGTTAVKDNFVEKDGKLVTFTPHR